MMKAGNETSRKRFLRCWLSVLTSKCWNVFGVIISAATLILTFMLYDQAEEINSNMEIRTITENANEIFDTEPIKAWDEYERTNESYPNHSAHIDSVYVRRFIKQAETCMKDSNIHYANEYREYAQKIRRKN
jgi:hypothetical protein